MFKNKLLAAAIIALLLLVNWLTFHDVFETHTLRDWIVLAASLLVFFYFFRISFKRPK